jgi:hypothetical protein
VAYRYDFKSTGLPPGNYQLLFTAQNDPVPHTAPFTLK